MLFSLKVKKNHPSELDFRRYFLLRNSENIVYSLNIVVLYLEMLELKKKLLS